MISPSSKSQYNQLQKAVSELLPNQKLRVFIDTDVSGDKPIDVYTIYLDKQHRWTNEKFHQALQEASTDIANLFVDEIPNVLSDEYSLRKEQNWQDTYETEIEIESANSQTQSAGR